MCIFLPTKILYLIPIEGSRIELTGKVAVLIVAAWTDLRVCRRHAAELRSGLPPAKGIEIFSLSSFRQLRSSILFC